MVPRTMTTRGSCLCGTVRWSVDGAFDHMTHCHCSRCRKAHAAPFATYASAKWSALSWTAGQEAIAHFASSPGIRRAFCARCGSVVPWGDDDDAYVPAGCLDDDPGIRPSAHIFVGSKAPWHVIADGLRRFDTLPDSIGTPVFARAPLDPAREGVLRGSCLCGEIAFEVEGPIGVVHNCHCSRCRKARAAAHTTNGFTTADRARFVRGQERVVRYRVPGARVFAHVFCGVCGSGTLMLGKERNRAGIPFGSLDDDPGHGAQRHIFVASKAPWYEIADDLPRFDEMPPPS